MLISPSHSAPNRRAWPSNSTITVAARALISISPVAGPALATCSGPPASTAMAAGSLSAMKPPCIQPAHKASSSTRETQLEECSITPPESPPAAVAAAPFRLR